LFIGATAIAVGSNKRSTIKPKGVGKMTEIKEQKPQYSDYIDLIRHEAWKRVRYNPFVAFEELVSQGHLAFAKATETWNPAKGKFSTHLTWQCRDYMGRVQGCRNYSEEVSLDEPEALQVPDPAVGPYEETKFRSGVAALSQEALEVVRLVLNIPWELVDWTIRWVRPSKGSIRQYLRSVGWSHGKIDRAFNEIKAMLAEL